MYAEPDDFDRDQLRAALTAGWHIDASVLRYHPVGFGSHHYIVDDDAWFVTVDEIRSPAKLERLTRAFESAAWLRERGLEFVHAPVRDRVGGLIRPLGKRFAVSVFAFVSGTSNPWGAHRSDEERRLVLAALGRLHATSATEATRRDALEVPAVDELHRALRELDMRWDGGPYSESARELLEARQSQVRDLLARYADLARDVAASDDAWVVTHGEPHGANVMRPRDGSVLLIDWDTVAVGPRERDLWMVEPRDDADWAAYTSHAPSRRPDASAMELYRSWWAAAEIADYTRTFRAPHHEDANTRVAWRSFVENMP